VSASDVVRQAAAIVGGGGGGRPTMARAGGKVPEKLADALAEAERLILAAL
jgi:alanyl-tRNA synthetase